MSDSRPDISIVIVSYNTRELTLTCLATLEESLAASDLDAEVWVVDNASADGSADLIAAHFPWARLIRNAENRGFAAANNQAFARSSGRYLMPLNSDAFVRRDTVECLVRYMDERPTLGVAGPKLVYEDGRDQISCYRLPHPLRAWYENLGLTALWPDHARFGDYRNRHDIDGEVEFVIGACMIVRREVYEAVGGFDERFFLYSEESDWQKRIAEAGWVIRFTPQTVVTHVAGGSGKSQPTRVNGHFFESVDRYMRKHYGIGGVLCMRAAMAVGCGTRAVAFTVVAAASRKRRSAAWARARFMRWLLLRQLTHWRMGA